MKRFTGHGGDEWGEFIDVKRSEKPLKATSPDSTILIGSVTDAYNPYEKKYELMRPILKGLINSDSQIEILTKSDLVLRDIDLLSQLKNVKVGISLNTLDDDFRKQTEPRASSVDRRLGALEELKKADISTYLFMSPIFPGITNFEEVIDATQGNADYICFENLNLRGGYMPRVLNFIQQNYPEHEALYNVIYKDKDMTYWEELKAKIINHCEKNGIDHRIYFYHDKIKKGGKNSKQNGDEMEGQLTL